MNEYISLTLKVRMLYLILLIITFTGDIYASTEGEVKKIQNNYNRVNWDIESTKLASRSFARKEHRPEFGDKDSPESNFYISAKCYYERVNNKLRKIEIESSGYMTYTIIEYVYNYQGELIFHYKSIQNKEHVERAAYRYYFSRNRLIRYIEDSYEIDMKNNRKRNREIIDNPGGPEIKDSEKILSNAKTIKDKFLKGEDILQ